MYYCIANARPAIVWPVDYDQFDHATRLVRAGIALRLHHLRNLEPLLRRALDDATLWQRCAQFRASCLHGGEQTLLQLVRQRIMQS